MNALLRAAGLSIAALGLLSGCNDDKTTAVTDAGVEDAGGAGAPRTSGGSVLPEPGLVLSRVRSTGARATGPLSVGAESPGHPFTATSVLVNTSTHAAAATMDRVAPRVASKPLGVRTLSTSAGKRSS